MIVFVYGSLKRGYALNHLLEGQRFLGTARTRPLYRIFDLGSYPGLVDWPDGLSIHGELYGIDEPCLGRLDDAEGVAEGLYARRPISLEPSTLPESVSRDVIIQAWFWLHSVLGKADCGKRWAP